MSIALGVVVLLACLYLNIEGAKKLLNGGAFFSSILVFGILYLALVLATYRVIAVWNGIELDLEEKTIEFPGGGIEANDLLDYIKPKFLLQYFKRIKISLNDVSQISSPARYWKHWAYKLMGADSKAEKLVYLVEMTGTFGAANLRFDSKGKRDELYTAIRQINQMGQPIVVI